MITSTRDGSKIAWILDEGSPGHRSQTDGVLAALLRRDPGIEGITVDVPKSLSGLERQWLRLWMRMKGRKKPLPKRLAARLLPTFNEIKIESSPVLILGSGGTTIPAGYELSLQTGAPFIYIGERGPWSKDWFATVFTPAAKEQADTDLFIERIPTAMTRVVDQPKSVVDDGTLRYQWAMIIGGRSRSHLFDKSDWRLLATGMNALAESYGIRWLVTTSRRTGAEAENTIREYLDSRYLSRAIWWAENPEKCMHSFLRDASHVFVTQDSVTMVSEAIASGRPAVVLHPRRVKFSKNSFLPEYMRRLDSSGQIQRISIENFPQSRIIERVLSDWDCPLLEDKIAEQLIQRVKWKG